MDTTSYAVRVDEWPIFIQPKIVRRTYTGRPVRALISRLHFTIGKRNIKSLVRVLTRNFCYFVKYYFRYASDFYIYELNFYNYQSLILIKNVR